MIRKIVLAGTMSMLFAFSSVFAGPVYLSLIIDPLTDADAGGTLDGTSTRSGPGTWHLYLFDDHTGSLGIDEYSVTMSGITTVLNRSPSTLFDLGAGAGNEDAGFRLLRSPNDSTPPVGAASNPITGHQPLPGTTSINPILGFGREASDFATKLPPGATVSSQTSPSWGDYATDPPTNLTGLFIAEGQYTPGTPPAITAGRVSVYVNAETFAVAETEECLGCNPPVGLTNSPPSVVDVVIGPPYNANKPGEPQTLTHQLVANDPDVGQTHTWDNLELLSYTPNYGGMGTGPHIAPTLSPSGLFTWVSEGSARGDYVWQVRATDNGVIPLSDNGTITVHVTGVPEPPTLLICSLALFTLNVVNRHRFFLPPNRS